MAGSYNHCVAADGSFTFDLIDDLGDAYEACEDMFQIIADRDAVIAGLSKAREPRAVERFLAHPRFLAIERIGGHHDASDLQYRGSFYVMPDSYCDGPWHDTPESAALAALDAMAKEEG